MNKLLNRLLDMLEQSTLGSLILALLLASTACYLWATGQPVPQELYYILTGALGLFFGAKSQKLANGARARRTS